MRAAARLSKGENNAMDTAAAAKHSLVIPDLLPTCVEAFGALQHLLVEARKGVSAMVVRGGRLDGALLDQHQFAAHGYAWFATYVSSLQ